MRCIICRITILFLAFFINWVTIDAQIFRNGMPQNNAGQSGEIYRNSFQHFLVSAENLFRQGNQLDALIQLDNAVEFAPQNPEVYLHRALLKYRIGMKTEAAQDAAIAARLNPVAPDLFGINGPKAQLDLLAFYPDQLHQSVEWSEHLAQYERLLDTWYAELGKESMIDYQSELETATIHLEAILNALEAENWPLAARHLATLSLIKPNTSALYDLEGLIFLKTEQLEKAANSFRYAIQSDPNNAMAWYNLSKISQKYGDFQTAVAHLDRALALNSSLGIAFFDRAFNKKELADIQGALIDYNQAIRFDQSLNLAAYFNRALCLKEIGRFSAALSDLEYLTNQVSANPLIWKVKGNIYLLSGFYNQAVADFTKAIELDYQLGEAYFNRGIAHLLNLNAMNACDDFGRSVTQGYDRAIEKQGLFCSN